MAKAARVRLRTKLVWGVGSAAEKIALVSVGSFAIFFYNQVQGMPATLAGLAMTVSLLVDGLADPVVGSLSDRTNSRLGRRHPFMFVAPLPAALSLFAIFNPPAILQPIWLFAWFAIFVVALRVSMTLFHTPHLALGGELSSDYTERSDIMAYNTFFGFTAEAVMSWAALTFFFHATPQYSRGLMNPHAYLPFALTAAGGVFLALFCSAWFTRDQIPHLPKPAPNLPRFSLLEFFKDVIKALGNRNYMFLLIAFFFISCTLGVRQGLLLYVQTFFWGLASEQIRWFVIGSVAGFVFSFFSVARLHGRFDKRQTIMVSGIVMSLTPVIAPVLRVLGYFPGPESAILLPLLIALYSVTMGSTTLLGITVMSALADIADENELKHGLRQEGILYSTRSLFGKIDVAVGTLLTGLALDLIGFPKGVAPDHVAHKTTTALALLDGIFPAIPGLIAVYFYSRYRIDKATYEATRAKLEIARAERRARAESEARPEAAAEGERIAAPSGLDAPPRSA